MLEAAKLKKLGNSGAAQVQQPQLQREKVVREQPVPRPVPAAAAVTADQEDNGLPFTDEIYGHLKYTIEKLTSRMKSPKVLTPDEIRKLEVSISAIIRDARGLPPAPPSAAVAPPVAKAAVVSAPSRASAPAPAPAPAAVQRAATPSTKPSAAQSATESVSNASGWAIPGMETMSTDEYYAALNKRIADAKAQRKAAGEIIGGRCEQKNSSFINK